MLRSSSKGLGNHVVSPEEEKERLQWEGCAEKEDSMRDINSSTFNQSISSLKAIGPNVHLHCSKVHGMRRC